MKTNYKKMNGFEAATVFVAALGIGLIGAEVYGFLPDAAQTNLKQSVAILDMHIEAASLGQIYSFAADVAINAVPEFYNQFSIAFAQTFSSDAVGNRALVISDSLSAYSQVVASNYEKNNVRAAKAEATLVASLLGTVQDRTLAESDLHPAVLGASVISNSWDQKSVEQLTKPTKYKPPGFLSRLPGIMAIEY